MQNVQPERSVVRGPTRARNDGFGRPPMLAPGRPLSRTGYGNVKSAFKVARRCRTVTVSGSLSGTVKAARSALCRESCLLRKTRRGWR
jgi:hypothetical protein